MNSKLETIASLVTTISVIDVGCDHGYLDIYLTKKGIKELIVIAQIDMKRSWKYVCAWHY